jgi:alpha-D-ribose 1-methylphosphonate 5-triphosphate synthase subunit PhnG
MNLVQAEMLSILNNSNAEAIKTFTNNLLELSEFQGLSVLENRTGLAMLPAVDSAQGTTFHLGEVLLSVARVQLGKSEGYNAVLGRDLEQALAVAILDVALAQGIQTKPILEFVNTQKLLLESSDQLLLAQVESTRVQMETF